MANSKLNEKIASLKVTESSNNKANNEEDLQRFTYWENDGDGNAIEEAPGNDGRRGWSVEEMFKTNQKLGVSTTFKDNLTQYTTCPPEGSKEDIERADRIAREIEQSDKSKRMAFLENDDEERDLDKETVIPKDAPSGDKRQNRNKRGKPVVPKAEPVAENHRANALLDSGPSQRGNRQQQATPSKKKAPVQPEPPKPEPVVASPVIPAVEASQSEPPKETTPITKADESDTSESNKKFHFDPNAPSFVPKFRPSSTPLMSMPPPRPLIPVYPQSYAPLMVNPVSQGIPPLMQAYPQSYHPSQAMAIPQGMQYVQPYPQGYQPAQPMPNTMPSGYYIIQTNGMAPIFVPPNYQPRR